MPRRVAAILAAILLAGPVLKGQQAPPPFRSQVDAIVIDAFVADRRGNAVRNLTADDFELLENGKPQAIASFGEVEVPAPGARQDPGAGVQTNIDSDGRLYVIAFGDLPPAFALRTSNLLRHFITDHVAANDLVSIVSVGSAFAGNAQDFTNDRQLLLKALDRFDGGQRGLFTQRMQSDALRDLLESLGRIPHRRKAVLYVTDRTFDVFDVIGGGDHPSAVDMGSMRDGLAVAMRGNVAIYTIDPLGLMNVGAGGESDGAVLLRTADLDRYIDMKRLAESTGGFAVVNSNQYVDAFARIARENSSYYLLGFTSTNTRRDGKYRRLEIRMKRPGLVVRARQGYIAPGETEPPPHTLQATGVTFAPAVAAALAHPVEDAAIPMWVSAKASGTSGTEADVVITAEVDSAALTAAEPVSTAKVELGVVAVSADGKLIRAQREELSLPTTTADAGERLRGTASLKLPPGRYQLRVATAAMDATRAGSVLYDLDVPVLARP